VEPHPHADPAASTPSTTSVELKPAGTQNPAASGPASEFRRGDVEEIRAVLAMKPPKKRGISPAVWFVIAFVALLAAIVAWQWTARAHSNESIAPPIIEQPKPPDFALDTSAPALASNTEPNPISRHSRTRHSSK